MVWDKKVLNIFQKDIEKNGYFHCPYSFKKFAKEHGLHAPQKTPTYVSIDFWSGQKNELRGRGWYVTRLSKGTFGVFSEDIFEKPYLELNIDTAKNLELEEFAPQPHIKDAFNLMMQGASAENSILELIRFTGTYEAILEDLSSPTEYIAGPRGNFTAKFDLHLKNKNRELVSFKYKGQIELDYSIWADDKIFIIEAKSVPKNGLDIGWHKLAYPTQHFYHIAQAHGVDIIPVYLLRNYTDVENTVYIYLFPAYESQNGGLILNDEKAMQPEHVYRIDLNKLLPLPQRMMNIFSAI